MNHQVTQEMSSLDQRRPFDHKLGLRTPKVGLCVS